MNATRGSRAISTPRRLGRFRASSCSPSRSGSGAPSARAAPTRRFARAPGDSSRSPPWACSRSFATSRSGVRGVRSRRRSPSPRSRPRFSAPAGRSCGSKAIACSSSGSRRRAMASAPSSISKAPSPPRHAGGRHGDRLHAFFRQPQLASFELDVDSIGPVDAAWRHAIAGRAIVRLREGAVPWRVGDRVAVTGTFLPDRPAANPGGRTAALATLAPTSLGMVDVPDPRLIGAMPPDTGLAARAMWRCNGFAPTGSSTPERCLTGCSPETRERQAAIC